MVIRMINQARIYRVATKPIRQAVLQLAVSAALKEHIRSIEDVRHVARYRPVKVAGIDQSEIAHDFLGSLKKLASRRGNARRCRRSWGAAVRGHRDAQDGARNTIAAPRTAGGLSCQPRPKRRQFRPYLDVPGSARCIPAGAQRLGFVLFGVADFEVGALAGEAGGF